MRKKLFLVDVSSLFFRAFFAIRPLTSPSGLPTNAIYGFLTMILKLLRTEHPEFLVFCFDNKEPNFRHELYSDYKAHRSEMPEDLAPQIPYIKKIAELLGIPAVEKVGFEADDLIGTLARLGEANEMSVYIVSGDKDFGQLIGDHIFLYDTMKDLKLDAVAVKEKWGVSPEKFQDYLALVGDSSDNVPGVSGIGPKGAQKLIEEFGSLESIYASLDKIKSQSVREKLERSKANAFLSKRLVAIDCQAPISSDFKDYHLRKVNLDDLRKFLLDLNFKSIEKTIGDYAFLNGGKDSKPDSAHVESLAPAVAQMQSVPAEIVSVKTSVAKNIVMTEVSPSQLASKIAPNSELWGFQTPQGSYIYENTSDELFVLRGTAHEFGQVLDSLQVQWSGFDLKPFWKSLHLHSPKILWDSKLAGYLLRPGDSLTFDSVYSRYTGKVASELPSPIDHLNMQLGLATELQARVEQVNGQGVLDQIDFPLLPILYEMENRGFKLDSDMLKEQSRLLTFEIQGLEKLICSLAGENFNIASPKQLARILFEKMQLPTSKKTKTGYSTDTDVLEKLKAHHPIAEHLIKFRELTKLKSTYLDALPQLIGADGRIHTTFNQTGTTTGRLSSIEPNLQNIPIRTENGARIRKAFIASEGLSLLSADYSQIELRILAHYSGDRGLTRAFEENLDIHAATASEIFGVSLKEVSDSMRRTAKAVNFGIAYGQGAFGLAETLSIPRKEAQDIISRYFAKFSGVKTYIEETVNQAAERGYVETLYGRRRYLDELKSANQAVRKFGERAAINAPIQGTAADIVKLAMVELAKKAKAPMILQVHDELIFEASVGVLEAEQALITETMEQVTNLRVPLRVNAGVGKDWDSAHR